jgi:hypothetical protein
VQGSCGQFFASSGCAQQQHRRVGRPHPCNQLQHSVKRGADTNHGLVTAYTLYRYGLEQFHEKPQGALLVQDGEHLHIHVLFAPGGLVYVQYPFPLAGPGCRRQWAILPRLITWSIIIMGDFVTASRLPRGIDEAEFVLVQVIGGQYLILGVHQDRGVLIAIEHPGEGGVGVRCDYFLFGMGIALELAIINAPVPPAVVGPSR